MNRNIIWGEKVAFMLVLFILALFANTASAQTTVPSPTPATVTLAWDHDGINLDGFHLYDGTTQLTPLVIAGTARSLPFPALTPGTHTLTIKAFNVAGESLASNALAVRVVVVPGAATNFRVIIARLIENVGWVPTLEVLPS